MELLAASYCTKSEALFTPFVLPVIDAAVSFALPGIGGMPFGSEAAGFAPGRGGIPLGRGLAPFYLVESYAADVLISCSLMIEMVFDLSLYSFSLEVSC